MMNSSELQQTATQTIKISFASQDVKQHFVSVREIEISCILEEGRFEGVLRYSVNDSTKPSDLVVGSFTMGPQIVSKGRTALDTHPLHHTQTSPPVMSASSPSKAETALDIIPEENLDLHQANQQEQQMEETHNIHGQVQGDNSLPVESHAPSTLQATSTPPVNKTPVTESSNLSVSNKSNVTYSSHHSSQASVNPQSISNVPIVSGQQVHNPEGPAALLVPFSEGRAAAEVTDKRKHTIYCALHKHELTHCSVYNTDEECLQNFDEEFARNFMRLLNTTNDVVGAGKEQALDEYRLYIEDHLRHSVNECPSFCSLLWKYCVDSNLSYLFGLAGEGLIIYSKNEEYKVGSSCSTYYECQSNDCEIGEGGFGIVYKFTDKHNKELAVKYETKNPLVEGDNKLFRKIIKLNHPHVIELLEYISGPVIQDKENVNRKSYLFVMPFMNRKGLDEQFVVDSNDTTKCYCVLDYMAEFGNQRQFVFRNFLELFHQVFNGLDYLRSQQLVHRDIKPSNILVQQNCQCESPFKCTCDRDDRVLYVLGDMGLLCHEGADAKSSYWKKMARRDPAGTIQMKAPESFYKTDEGEPMITHRSDVWSGCVTMMIVLVSKEINTMPLTQISQFLRKGLGIIKTASRGVNDSCQQLKGLDKAFGDMQKILAEEKITALNNEISSMSSHLKKLNLTLSDSNLKLQEVQSFHGGYPEFFKEDSPLAGILSTVYVANSLHWTCLMKLNDVYGTALWKCMCDTLAIIAEGVRFMPDERKTAAEVVELLLPIKNKIIMCQAGRCNWPEGLAVNGADGY